MTKGRGRTPFSHIATSAADAPDYEVIKSPAKMIVLDMDCDQKESLNLDSERNASI